MPTQKSMKSCLSSIHSTCKYSFPPPLEFSIFKCSSHAPPPRTGEENKSCWKSKIGLFGTMMISSYKGLLLNISPHVERGALYKIVCKIMHKLQRGVIVITAAFWFCLQICGLRNDNQLLVPICHWSFLPAELAKLTRQRCNQCTWDD